MQYSFTQFFDFPVQAYWSCYRQAGKQIQGVIRSACKIERQVAGDATTTSGLLSTLNTLDLYGPAHFF